MLVQNIHTSHKIPNLYTIKLIQTKKNVDLYTILYTTYYNLKNMTIQHLSYKYDRYLQ